MKNKLIILLTIVTLLIIGDFLVYKYWWLPSKKSTVVVTPIEPEETECEQWHNKECAEEGENLCGPCGCKSCCSGLVKRNVTYPYRNKNNEVFCLEEMTAYTCVKCGDKTCGKGEDWCICPEDCSRPNPEDLQVFITPE